MKKRRLGKSLITVSEISIGTMTFGSFADEQESFDILDRCFDAGVNFVDTAEIYPVPPDASYIHRTEEITGKWLSGRPRDSVILASKVAGPGHGWFAPPLRSGLTCIDRRQIKSAVEDSLKRLKTDYIDLYQIHWPDHDAGKSGYYETLQALHELKLEGKIRLAGCSNETSWGLMKSIQTAEESSLFRYETIQNNYSILNRRFEDSLADICRREGISLLAYSPLAGGVATGKYNEPEVSEKARFAKYLKEADRQRKQSHRFLNEKTLTATAEYMELADELQMSVTTLAVAFSKQHDFVASTIIGASHPDQLTDSLAAAGLVLPEEVMERINEINNKILYPMG